MKRVKKKKGNMKFHRNRNMIRRTRKRKLQQRKITLKATQKRNKQHWNQKKKEIIQYTENEEQNREENEKDQRKVELTDKREKEYIITAVNIERQGKR